MIKINKYECFSQQGIRDNNEDYILPREVSNSNRIFVLCDGMGGHGHGEIASSVICTSIYEYLTNNVTGEYTQDNLQASVDYALEELNRADIYNDEKRMGTTVVIVALNRYDILVGHIGDSRCYLFNEVGEKKFRTTDHSMVAEAVANEILTEEEAFNSPKKNIITRCIKSGETYVELTVDRIPNDIFEPNDLLFLCTDGVNDALRDNEIVALLTQEEISTLSLQEECKIKSKDNFSGILIQITSTETIEIEHKAHMPLCIRCSIKLREGSIYCPNCGQNQQEDIEPEPNPSFITSELGKTDHFKKRDLDDKGESDFITIPWIKLKVKKKDYMIYSVIIMTVLLIINILLSLIILTNWVQN